MESKPLFIIRLLMVVALGGFLMKSSGIIAFIDFLQLAEVFFGMLLLAIGVRVFSRKGLLYIAEFTSLLMGVMFMLLGLLQAWLKYGELNIQMVYIYGVSLFYGICLSLGSTTIIWNHKKRISRRGEQQYE